MVNAYDLHNVGMNSIYDNVREPGENSFAGASNPSEPTEFRKSSEAPAVAVNGICYLGGCGGVILLNALDKL